MFIDESIITVISGKGGDGAATFRREKFVQFGGPDGGDGGKGGDIVFITDPNINTLVDFRNNKKFQAGDGTKGGTARCTGKSGEDLVIKVPVGTMIRDLETNRLLCDLDIPNKKVIFLKGGDGGRGNIHFKSSIRKAPKIAESGKEGAELKIKLELKLLADVALVGYPSVGKSSFINKVSAAKSKVASYHFTTLKPKLGMVRMGDEESFVIADIPGLIEGAHEGVGLGDRFLKHIERCKLIIHIVDISGLDGRDPKDDFIKINKELANYSEKLSKKIQIVVANKIDMLYEDEKYDEFENFVKENGIKYVYPISVIANEGLKVVLSKAWELIQKIPREELEEEYSVDELLKEINKKEDWIITNPKEHVFVVDGRIVDNVLRKYVFSGDEGIINFLQVMRNLGMEIELEKAGVEEGDLIVIAGYEFEYVL
ncbi:MAG: GTPase ObgE [Leptotrichiaceae bacterium]|nr:GTPase ObgE [Leptotrichiaceae bacterium]